MSPTTLERGVAAAWRPDVVHRLVPGPPPGFPDAIRQPVVRRGRWAVVLRTLDAGCGPFRQWLVLNPRGYVVACWPVWARLSALQLADDLARGPLTSCGFRPPTGWSVHGGSVGWPTDLHAGFPCVLTRHRDAEHRDRYGRRWSAALHPSAGAR